jgi:hypothetical protein
MADPRLLRLCIFAVVVVVGTQLFALWDGEDPATPYLDKARRKLADGDYDAAEAAFSAGVAKLHHHPRLRLAWGEFLRDDRHDFTRAESEFTDFAGDAGIKDPLQMVAWREAGELAWARRDHAAAAQDFANAQSGDQKMADPAAWVLATWLRGSDGDRSAWAATPPARTGPDGKDAPDDVATCLWLAAQNAVNPANAQAFLHRAAVAQAAADAEAAALIGADQDDSAKTSESDPAKSPSPFIRALTARVQAAAGDDASAAKSLDDAAHTARTLPLTQEAVHADPVFAKPGPLLEKMIATLPKK